MCLGYTQYKFFIKVVTPNKLLVTPKKLVLTPKKLVHTPKKIALKCIIKFNYLFNFIN